MKLRNKKTGEIKRVEFLADYHNDDGTEIGFRVANTLDAYSYNSLAELNEEWEDYEEPAYYYFIHDGRIGCDAIDPYNHKSKVEERKPIGNYFETREEAEKAVEKLNAWKRLKDKGFRFKYWSYKMDEPKIENHTHFMIVGVCEDGVRFDDLDLLFGGEE